MAKPLYIDVATGEARIALNGSVNQRMRLFLRDLVPLDIAFIKEGVLTTSTILDGGTALLKVGLREKPGQGSILALATIYTLSGEVARTILNLNTVALVNYFAAQPADINDHELTLEVEVTKFDQTELTTYYQAKCIVAREVNVSDDDPPVPAAEADQYVKWSELPVLTGLESLPDVQITNPKNDFDFLTWRVPVGKWVNNRVADGGNF